MSHFRPSETPYLLPPSLDEWLPRDHLARFVAHIVEQSVGPPSQLPSEPESGALSQREL